MGLIGKLLTPSAITAAAGAARDVAEVFTPSATRAMELSAEAQAAALKQFAQEFEHPTLGWFDRMVDGLNRLPRPMLAFGTIGLFVFAMTDPLNFSRRMVGLNAVPEPLWWLLGAVVTFYFGSRETHYFRNRRVSIPLELLPEAMAAPANADPTSSAASGNPALDDWRHNRAANG